MSATINITVEDVTQRLADGFTRIELERSTLPDASFAQVTTINLVAGQYIYTYLDINGSLNLWYRYRFTGVGGAAPVSDYSNPQRPEGVSRVKLRQYILSRYRAGLTLLAHASAPGDSNTIVTSDYRVFTSLFQVGRGSGQWTYPASGVRLGEARWILPTSSPSAGNFEISPAMSGPLGNSDQFEWHWLVDPNVMNDAINRGLRKYWYLDRVPIVGVADQDEYNLDYLPWLDEKDQVMGVWYYPNEQANDSVSDKDRPWANDGHWWDVRQDAGGLTLSIFPRVTETTTLYLEVLRQMPELFTDNSVLPPPANIELAAALAYDEVLGYLAWNPIGASEDSQVWGAARVRHSQTVLRPLLRQHRPRPRPVPAMPRQPLAYLNPYIAR